MTSEYASELIVAGAMPGQGGDQTWGVALSARNWAAMVVQAVVYCSGIRQVVSYGAHLGDVKR